MIDKLEKADVPVATSALTYPIWAEALMPSLQFVLAILGGLYLLLRMYREYILTKLAKRQLDMPGGSSGDEE